MHPFMNCEPDRACMYSRIIGRVAFFRGSGRNSDKAVFFGVSQARLRAGNPQYLEAIILLLHAPKIEIHDFERDFGPVGNGCHFQGTRAAKEFRWKSSS